MIERLKKIFGIHKKSDVIRAGLELLEKEAHRLKQIKRWELAAQLVAESSHAVNKEFQKYSMMNCLNKGL